jgi:translation initiation factor IF-3
MISEDGKQLGIMNTRDALELASGKGLDLVEIQPNAEPPVARAMDRGKFLFKKSKEKSAAKKKQKQIKVKEIKFRPTTDKNDYEVKLRNLRGFLEGGDKVKVTVWFKGREMTHQELGGKLLERVRADLDDLGKVEHFPKLEGKQLIMILSPKGKN